MKKLLFTFFTLFIFSQAFSQKSWKSLDDPEKTTKTFIKDIQNMESEEFAKKYSLTLDDFEELIENAEKESLLMPKEMNQLKKEIGPENKENIQAMISKLSKDTRRFHSKNIEMLSKCDFHSYYYELKAKRKDFTPTLMLHIIVQHKEGHYYLIKMDEAVYVDGTWKPLKFINIESCDAYGELLFDRDTYSEEAIEEVEED